jgi:hypothetical protein
MSHPTSAKSDHEKRTEDSSEDVTSQRQEPRLNIHGILGKALNMALDMGKTMEKGHRKKHGETIHCKENVFKDKFQEGT